MHLVIPAAEHLESYVNALRRGWSPDNHDADAGRAELRQIEADPSAFLAGQVDTGGNGPTITLPDGSSVPRLPGYHRWMWDGEFCGTIGIRWQPGTEALPPYCLGHIGFAVVPWKRGLGYATEALRTLLPGARQLGLRYVELTCNATNNASRHVITANGGVLVGEFDRGAARGGGTGLRFRIELG
ncbi:MAG: GNAT family N-acetyltransferase [Gemmatimonadales bacterium]